MGFYVRKSLRAGPFRFNVSTSGLGVSAGVPGFRVGTGPRGNYVHVGAHGVYYRASPGAGPRRGHPGVAPPSTAPAWRPPAGAEVVMQDTTGATATELLPSTPDDFVAQLNAAAGRFALWPWAAALVVVAALAAPPPAGVAIAIAGLAATVWLALRDRARRSVVAFFQVEGTQADWFQALVTGVETLSQASALWRVDASGNVTTTYQYKVNSGASRLLRRSKATVGMAGPKVLVTNIAVPSLASGGHSLHFLPDRVLVRDGRRFASVSYAHLDAMAQATRFIEDGRVPCDARRVDTTWRYVNVKGGPDRRFKDNRELPVMLYGQLELGSPDGLRWILQASQVPAAERVAGALRQAVAPAPVPAPALTPAP